MFSGSYISSGDHDDPMSSNENSSIASSVCSAINEYENRAAMEIVSYFSIFFIYLIDLL